MLRPRLTGTPHSQLRFRLRQRAQIGRSSPHFTLRRRQVLQPGDRTKKLEILSLDSALEDPQRHLKKRVVGRQDQPFFDRGAFRPDIKNQTPPSRVSRSRETSVQASGGDPMSATGVAERERWWREQKHREIGRSRAAQTSCGPCAFYVKADNAGTRSHGIAGKKKGKKACCLGRS